MLEYRPLVAGNWKMNGLQASSAEILAIKNWYLTHKGNLRADLLICPPATLIVPFAAQLAGTGIRLGAQTCHHAEAGAFTGDLSAPMLRDAGATAIIAGHSERRFGYGERDADVKAKARAAHLADMQAIICVGETAGERRMGLTLPVIGRQLRGSIPQTATASNTIIAYEPVWAIGSGITPGPDDIAAVHRFIRETLAAMAIDRSQQMRILYGGSLKPGNAREIFALANVDGGLVGGASLIADDFSAIAAAYLP